jgi:protein-S-isoprenylcysteine O-methyltransferase Ste14
MIAVPQTDTSRQAPRRKRGTLDSASSTSQASNVVPPAVRRLFSLTGMLDVVERLAIAALYVWLVVRLVRNMESGSRLANGLLLISEGLVILFLITRKTTTAVSLVPSHWLLSIGATCGPLLVNPSRGEPIVPVAFAAGLWLLGTFLQVSAKIALGRSFGCIPAHRGLKRGGPYRLVRHPMYAGYLLSHLAFLLMNPTLGNFLIYAICDAIQIPRIRVEEQLLGRDPHYVSYCKQVRWRVVPGLF